MTDQKAELLAKGWSEQELKENHWRARPWTEGTDLTWDQHMNDRDRLTCPECKAIGTFKPRFNKDYKHPRYYVCKWCGYGRDHDGEWQYYPDAKNGCWGIITSDSGMTPKEIMAEHNLDPWCG